MKCRLHYILIFCSLNLLAACQKHLPAPLASNPANRLATVAATSPGCQSFNFGDNLQPQLNSNSLQLNLPVARLNNSLQGRAVVLLPVNDAAIRFFWVRQDSRGKWSLAEKQTVLQVQPGRLDASPMHRLHYNDRQQKVVLFVTLPAANWQKGISIQPVLEERESRWGKLEPFNARLTPQGFAHPFRGIDRGLSGNILPDRLAEVMDRIEPGSIYVPRIYASKLTVLKPSLVDRNLCPLAGSR
ncbi:MAG: hypothetical protein MUE44_14825 [Oscillatoriaceae cyanobacterium Prado104]|jgi:hypothetical protein|nr:hypothetical protein [Oscillatoriaceae cyanobacterium Prado104]